MLRFSNQILHIFIWDSWLKFSFYLIGEEEREEVKDAVEDEPKVEDTPQEDEETSDEESEDDEQLEDEEQQDEGNKIFFYFSEFFYLKKIYITLYFVWNPLQTNFSKSKYLHLK